MNKIEGNKSTIYKNSQTQSLHNQTSSQPTTFANSQLPIEQNRLQQKTWGLSMEQLLQTFK